jgi:hypothetical protein
MSVNHLGKQDNRLPIALLSLRLSIFLVFLMWTLDKFLNPDHAAAVFENFYRIGGLGQSVFLAIGALQMAIILGFVLGIEKVWTYGAVLGMHTVSTLSSYRQYLNPFEGSNLLFFAAIPMLAACYALFSLRTQDTLWTVKS